MIKRLAFLGLLPLALFACQQEQQSTTATTPAAAPTINLSTAEIPAAGVVITNAHILDGAGGSIERGSIVIEGNRIVSVNTGNVTVPGALVVDAEGYTVMPGFIDGHRHLISGDPDAWLANEAEDRVREFAEAGFTTVVSLGDNEEAILELKRRLNSGELRVGPRLFTSGRVQLGGPLERIAPVGDGARFDPARPRFRPQGTAARIPEDEIRARVQEIADAGHEYVKTGILITPDGPEIDTLRIVAEESARLGLVSTTHAVAIRDVLAAVEAGTHAINHTPHIEGFLTLEQAQTIADSGIPMISTIGIFTPFYHEGNVGLFRDGLESPWEDLSSAGTGPVNAKLLANAGTVYGFGTDVRYHPLVTLESELKTLFLTFSHEDIIQIMGRNSAAAILREDDLGTLEAGKLADLVFVNGNPLENLFFLMNVDVVMKDGQFIVDKR